MKSKLLNRLVIISLLTGVFPAIAPSVDSESDYLWISGIAGALPLIHKIDPFDGNIVLTYPYANAMHGLAFGYG